MNYKNKTNKTKLEEMHEKKTKQICTSLATDPTWYEYGNKNKKKANIGLIYQSTRYIGLPL